MDPAEHLDVLRTESRAFAKAAGRDFGPAVAACPGWTVRDLVWHLGEVYLHWLSTLNAARAGSRDKGPDPALPDVATIDVAWFEAVADELHATMAATDTATPMWNWTGLDETVGWLYRRMAQETAVHRADAELAVDPASTPVIRADVAADGIAELGENWIAGTMSYFKPEQSGRFDMGGSLLVRPTDAPTAWRFDLRGLDHADTRPAVAGESADCLVDGTASDLLLLLWGRIPADHAGLTRSGDPSILDGWRRLPIFS